MTFNCFLTISQSQLAQQEPPEVDHTLESLQCSQKRSVISLIFVPCRVTCCKNRSAWNPILHIQEDLPSLTPQYFIELSLLSLRCCTSLLPPHSMLCLNLLCLQQYSLRKTLGLWTQSSYKIYLFTLSLSHCGVRVFLHLPNNILFWHTLLQLSINSACLRMFFRTCPITPFMHC